MIMAGVKERGYASTEAVAITFLKNPMKLALYQHLAVFKKLECKDPKDRVFSLLSISRDGADYTVDYSLSLWELFIQTLRISVVDAWCTSYADRKRDAAADRYCFLPDCRYMPKLRDVCGCVSSALFGLDFCDLDVNDTSQLCEDIDTALWKGIATFCGNAARLVLGDESWHLDNLSETERWDPSNIDSDGTSYSDGHPQLALIIADDYEGLFAPSARFLGLESVFLAAQKSRRGYWGVLAVGSFDTDETKESVQAAAQTWSPMKTCMNISSPALDACEEIQSISEEDTGSESSCFVLYMTLASLLELSQIICRLSGSRSEEGPSAYADYDETIGHDLPRFYRCINHA